MKRLLALISIFSLAGCATAVNGVDERVRFASEPAGAQVRITRIDQAQERVALEGRCETPCSMVLDRGPTYRARFTKDGCGPVNVRLYPTFDSAFYFAVIPDFWTGGAYDIQPNPISIKMTCGMDVEQRRDY
jgi:hypothetical protein